MGTFSRTKQMRTKRVKEKKRKAFEGKENM
jgi:hypothetical protein